MLESIAARVSGLLGRRSPLIRQLRPAYETLLSWSNGGHGIPCTINGVEFRRDPRCRQYYSSNFDYEPAVAAYLRAMVKPDQICFDVEPMLVTMYFSSHIGRVPRGGCLHSNPTRDRVLSSSGR